MKKIFAYIKRVMDTCQDIITDAFTSYDNYIKIIFDNEDVIILSNECLEKISCNKDFILNYIVLNLNSIKKDKKFSDIYYRMCREYMDIKEIIICNAGKKIAYAVHWDGEYNNKYQSVKSKNNMVCISWN